MEDEVNARLGLKAACVHFARNSYQNDKFFLTGIIQTKLREGDYLSGILWRKVLMSN